MREFSDKGEGIWKRRGHKIDTTMDSLNDSSVVRLSRAKLIDANFFLAEERFLVA